MNQQQELFCQSNSTKQPPLNELPEVPYHIYNPFWPLPFYHYPKYPLFPINTTVSNQNPSKPFFYSSTTTQTIDEDFEKEPINQVSEHQPLSSFVKEENFDSENEKEPMIPNQEPSQHFLSTFSKSQILDSEFEKASLTPTVQKPLETMLKTYQIEHEVYEQIFKDNTRKNSLVSLIIEYFDEKITTFKKSKEEMIKLVIRKTQRYYKVKNNCKRDDRFKKYGGFKSMNTSYLEKIFSDADFANCFMAVNQNFLEEFQQENDMKINIFFTKACEAENWEELKKSVKSLDEKNKMPWPVFWINRLKKVIEELQINYLVAGGQEIDQKLKKRC